MSYMITLTFLILFSVDNNVKKNIKRTKKIITMDHP